MERHPSGTVRPKHINIQRHKLTNIQRHNSQHIKIQIHKLISSKLYKWEYPQSKPPPKTPIVRLGKDHFFLSFRNANTNLSYFSSNQIQIQELQVLWRSIHGICFQIRQRSFLLWLKILLQIHFWEQSILAGYQLNTKSVVRSCKNLSFLSLSKI